MMTGRKASDHVTTQMQRVAILKCFNQYIKRDPISCELFNTFFFKYRLIFHHCRRVVFHVFSTTVIFERNMFLYGAGGE